MLGAIGSERIFSSWLPQAGDDGRTPHPATMKRCAYWKRRANIAKRSADGFHRTVSLIHEISATLSVWSGITITAPNTAITWAIGSVARIRWNHNLGTAETVRIRLIWTGNETISDDSNVNFRVN